MTFETAVFDYSAKQMLEDLFGMSTGYVMDFNNGTFASFVETCFGFDPYQRYEGSKAVILRQIWLNEPFADVAKLNLDLLSKWKLNKLRAGEEPTKYEQHALEALRGPLHASGATGPHDGRSRLLEQGSWSGRSHGPAQGADRAAGHRRQARRDRPRT